MSVLLLRRGILASARRPLPPRLLDLYPGAGIALSVRLLRARYAGPCMQVRRDSDNDHIDLGFADGWLDVAPLPDFLGEASGYIAAWYDQVTGDPVAQSTMARQPRIASEGVLHAVGGIPAPMFGLDGVTSLMGTSPVVTQAPFTVFTVARPDSTGGVGRLWDNRRYAHGTGPAARRGRFTTVGWRDYEQNNVWSEDAPTIHTLRYDTAFGATFFANGSQVGNTVPSEVDGPVTPENIVIGARAIGSEPWVGPIQELIIYPSDQADSRAAIEAHINADFGVF